MGIFGTGFFLEHGFEGLDTDFFACGVEDFLEHGLDG